MLIRGLKPASQFVFDFSLILCTQKKCLYHLESNTAPASFIKKNPLSIYKYISILISFAELSQFLVRETHSRNTFQKICFKTPKPSN